MARRGVARGRPLKGGFCALTDEAAAEAMLHRIEQNLHVLSTSSPEFPLSRGDSVFFHRVVGQCYYLWGGSVTSSARSEQVGGALRAEAARSRVEAISLTQKSCSLCRLVKQDHEHASEFAVGIRW